MAMPPMLKTLYQHPEMGFLGGYTTLGAHGPVSVQYWRSFEDLERFARNPDDPHLPAWKQFNKLSRGSGSVGIWHETYLVEPGQFEAMYAGMPRYGLAEAVEHQAIAQPDDTARGRLAT